MGKFVQTIHVLLKILSTKEIIWYLNTPRVSDVDKEWGGAKKDIFSNSEIVVFVLMGNEVETSNTNLPCDQHEVWVVILFF